MFDFMRNRRILTSIQRSTHAYLIGQSGVGKTRALESWIMQDILANRGVGVIDPHGDLFRRLVLRIAWIPQVWDRVIILDPCNPKWVVNFNPLQTEIGISNERHALYLADIVVKIWGLNIASSPRLIWLLINTFLALSNLDLSLLDLPRFLLDREYRDNLVLRVSNERIRAFFTFEFPTTYGAVHQWVTPVLNKIGNLIFDPDVRPMLAGKSSLDFHSVIDQGMILLVNLPKGILGEGTSALLGAFIVAHLQKAALSRAGQYIRDPFYLYLDEFQNYTTDNIQDILSESRKYGLALILAHQYLDQLSTDLRSAVLNTAGALVSFRVGHRDAQTLVKEIFPSPNYLSRSESHFVSRRISGLSLPWTMLERKESALGWDGLAQTLAQLSHREFWVRLRGHPYPTKMRSLDVPDPIISPDLRARRQEFLDRVGKRYGHLKQDSRGGFDSTHESFRVTSQDEIRFWSEL